MSGTSTTSTSGPSFTLAVRLSVALAYHQILVDAAHRDVAQMDPEQAKQMLGHFLVKQMPTRCPDLPRTQRLMDRYVFDARPVPHRPPQMWALFWPVRRRVEDKGQPLSVLHDELIGLAQPLVLLLGKADTLQPSDMPQRRSFTLRCEVVALPGETDPALLANATFKQRLNASKIRVCDHWPVNPGPVADVKDLANARALKAAARGVVADSLKLEPEPQTALPASCVGGGLGERPSAQVVNIFSQPRRR